MKGVKFLFALSIFIYLSSAEWLQFALQTQRELLPHFTIDKAPLVATHNSYSSAVYNSLFTNQYLSLTAQLQLGVRWMELDLHYVKELVSSEFGPYRICHANTNIYDACQQYGWNYCNFAGLINYEEDTGCLPTNPNFTSIFEEISIWKNANPEEIVVIYFDEGITNDDISLAPNMASVMNTWFNTYFGTTIYSPADLISDGTWPSIASLKARGKTLILTTSDHTFGGTYIHADFRGFGYPASNVEYFSGYPTCKSTYRDYTGDGKVSFGFFQEDRSSVVFNGLVIVNGTADVGAFSHRSALETMQCQFSMFVDFITNDTNMLVWSWDLGQPSGSNKCASISNQNGRWKAEKCGSVSHHFACRSDSDVHSWTISSSASIRNSTTACPSGFSFSTPRTALENLELLTAIQNANLQENVWISMNQYPNGTWSEIPTTYEPEPDDVQSSSNEVQNPESHASKIAFSYLFFFAATCILLVL